MIAAAVVIRLTGWQQADAVAGLAIAAFIVPRALLLLRDNRLRVGVEFTLPGLDLDEAPTCWRCRTCGVCTSCTRRGWRPVCRCCRPTS